MKGRTAMVRAMLVVVMALWAMPLAGQGVGVGVAAGVGTGVQAGQEGWLGVGLSCDNCSLRRSRSEPGRWTFREPPTIFWVDPYGPADRAGLRRGDTLIAIDGQQLTSEAGGRAFARVAPGQQVRITYRRGTQERQARLTAAARPESEATTATTTRLRQMQEQQEQQLERQRQLRESRQAQVDQAREEMRQVAYELARLNSRMRARDTAAAEAMRRRLLAAESALTALSAISTIPPVELAPRALRPGGKYLPGVAAVPPLPPVAPVAPV
ncbi:MAG: PDZ domain-containing protein, partial [Gemmatimonadales bacterium]|nr:PDZ domain-containing protein [Gemmatimonadales bacterium]